MSYFSTPARDILSHLGKVDDVLAEIYALTFQGFPEGRDIYISGRYPLFDRDGGRRTGSLPPVCAGHHAAARTRLVRHVGHGDGLAGYEESVNVFGKQAAVGNTENSLEIGNLTDLTLIGLISLAAVRRVHNPAFVIGYLQVRPGEGDKANIIVEGMTLADIFPG